MTKIARRVFSYARDSGMLVPDYFSIGFEECHICK